MAWYQHTVESRAKIALGWCCKSSPWKPTQNEWSNTQNHLHIQALASHANWIDSPKMLINWSSMNHPVVYYTIIWWLSLYFYITDPGFYKNIILLTKVVWPLGPPNHVQITCPGEKRAGCGPRHLWIFCSLSHSTDGRRGEAMEPWTGVWIYDMMTI